MSNRNIFGISGLTSDDDGDMERLHFDGSYDNIWTANTAKEYAAIEKRINKIGTNTAYFEVYAWYDISGFDYWVKRQQEPNYIQISVLIKKKLKPKQVHELSVALQDAASDAECIAADCASDVEKLYE